MRRSIGVLVIIISLILLMNYEKKYTYAIYFTQSDPDLKADWDSPDWKSIPAVQISNFRPESTNHNPLTSVKLQYSQNGISGIFLVQDRYVKCVHQNLQDPVHKDSCVEFFVQPGQDSGYFNFEFNCGGCLSCSYITYHYGSEGTVELNKNRLSKEDLRQVRIFHSLPDRIETEITEPVEWRLGFFIPFSLLEKYIGIIDLASQPEWKGNFYKCGSGTSHPHWASWSPVDEKNFHLPHCFGALKFEDVEKSIYGR